MTNTKTDTVMNSVWILDAIPANELQTARNLRDNLLDLNVLDPVGIQIDKIRTPVDLEEAFRKILLAVVNNGFLPWIHLEAHGNQSGFRTGMGLEVNWEKLAKLCSAVNAETNFQTLVLLAACNGFDFARAMSPIPLSENHSNTRNRAPCIGFIGPTETKSAGAIYDSFSIFYKSFFDGGSMRSALETLKDGGYAWTTAQEFFRRTLESFARHSQKPKNHVRRLRKEIVKMGLASSIESAPSLRELYRLLPMQKRKVVNDAWSYYFLHDIYPENKLRFPLPHDS